MAKKTKIKISSYKNKKGQSVACTRVYSESGELLSEHEASGTTVQEASAAALHKMNKNYEEIEEYDVSSSKLEYVSSTKPLSLKETSEELDKLTEEYAQSQEGSGEEQLPSPQSEPPRPKFVKGLNGKKHIDHREYDELGIDGVGHSALSEPVPNFFARPGDLIINSRTMKIGNDNNTHIVLGRDRSGLGEYNSKDKKKSQSGYSDNMGAGAIDIVVGRCAPFPPAGKEFGPMYTTFQGPNAKSAFADVILNGTNPEGVSAPHPGYAMDAARIYISQMTDIDENFKISKRIRATSDQTTRLPSAGIMIKADKVRMHARNDIKIVTGGNNETYTSMGARNLSVGGIHLVAGNGDAGDQHPIPRGYALEKALAQMIEMHKSLVDIVFGFVKTQMSYNKELATHFHQSPAMGASTTPSITGWALGVETQVSHFRNFVMEIPKHLYNAENYKKRYLTTGEDMYINSMHNTTN
jgi:hypothetical protein